ncbi:GNAT family N-acetyltransferase [Streptomyces gelaticus]|uniref:GNAT family N-acetyltransferase n=1 Tax=Streptomyces gelaticus TaxID=285446 RepID=UPI001E39CF4D|nr:GNAT family N-acetyltransferase [Streptomyces gelaticus]
MCFWRCQGPRPTPQQFEEAASEQDLDEAFVELDHWAAHGALEDGRLVCVASMYPWNDAPLADLGVLTLPPYRGKGHARRLVRAISRHALARKHEPQYRCQLDNHASVAAAESAGLTRFGPWDVVSPVKLSMTSAAVLVDGVMRYIASRSTAVGLPDGVGAPTPAADRSWASRPSVAGRTFVVRTFWL